MDEEFIGGTTLQGHCSNFRGKLCIWAHLLKVTPENSRQLVNKLVPPKQTGSTSYDKIIANVEVDSLGGTKQAAMASAAKSFAAATQGQNGAPASQPQTKANDRAKSTTLQKKSTEALQSNNRPTSRQRPASSGRGKQVPFKESRGPNKKGNGFNDGPGKRVPASGLNKWKNLVGVNEKKGGKKSKQPNDATKKDFTKSDAANDGAAQLKAMLGVGSSQAPAPVVLPSSATDASAGLKAMLGVGGSATPTPNSPPLQQIPNPPPPPPEMMAPAPPPQPATAADKLFAMMKAKQQPQAPPSPMYAAPPSSSFNFTYVKEGEETPSAPAPAMPLLQMRPRPMQMQYTPNHFSYGYPAPPPTHMMPPPPMHMQGRHPVPAAVNGPSAEDFPPLGVSPNTKGRPAEKIEEKKTSGDSVMVPSAVASKPRK